MITLTDEEAKELRDFINDINSNRFASGEIQAMGGVRVVLRDELLTKLGFKIDGPPPPLATMRKS
jgi:hypothetical protein